MSKTNYMVTKFRKRKWLNTCVSTACKIFGRYPFACPGGLELLTFWFAVNGTKILMAPSSAAYEMKRPFFSRLAASYAVIGGK